MSNWTKNRLLLVRMLRDKLPPGWAVSFDPNSGYIKGEFVDDPNSPTLLISIKPDNSWLIWRTIGDFLPRGLPYSYMEQDSDWKENLVDDVVQKVLMIVGAESSGAQKVTYMSGEWNFLWPDGEWRKEQPPSQQKNDGIYEVASHREENLIIGGD